MFQKYVCFRIGLTDQETHSMKKNIRPVMACLLLASVVFSSNAFAQWQWLDDSGRKVYSDMPPPISVPESRVLAQPGRAVQLAPAATAFQAPSNPHDVKGQTAPQTAPAVEEVLPPTPEQLALEKEQAAQQAAVEAQNKQIKAANCTAARRALGQLDSGRRATTTNARGEVVFMDEATRNQQRQQTQSIIDSNC